MLTIGIYAGVGYAVWVALEVAQRICVKEVKR